MMTNLSRRIITMILITVSVSSRSAAQPPPPPPINYSYDNPIGITSAMIIILSTIIALFLLMGFLSVYGRRCVDHSDAATFPGGGFIPSGSRPTNGLDQAAVESFPKFVYSEVKGMKIGKGALECAVCLCEFDDVDTLRLLPKCCHVFHQNCIDTWLNSNVTCPVCRAVLVALPGQTDDFVLPVLEPFNSDTISYHSAEDDIIIDILSPEQANSSTSPKQTLPPRSTSRKNRLFGKFNRSFTTGHVMVRSDDNYSRFTLRLPEEVRNKLVSRSRNQNQTGTVLPRVRSKRNGYRSASVGATKGRNLLSFERFEPEGRPDRWRFTKTKSVFSRTGSVRSPDLEGEQNGAQHLANAPKSLLRSVRSPFRFTLLGTTSSINDDVNYVGERSFDRLKLNDDQV